MAHGSGGAVRRSVRVDEGPLGFVTGLLGSVSALKTRPHPDRPLTDPKQTLRDPNQTLTVGVCKPVS